MPARYRHVCQQCGAETPRWAGQCPSCEAWNTLVETVISRPVAGARARDRTTAAFAVGAISPISEVSSAEADRLVSGIGEVDRVLGGGLVPGSIVLFGGDPGIGKSTLLLQLAARLAAGGSEVLYMTGEESASQVRGRAERVGRRGQRPRPGGHHRARHGGRGDRVGGARRWPWSTASRPWRRADLTGPAGSVGQVREVATRLAEVAKAGRTCVALVGHVTKEGTVAGPRTLEHLVDAVIYLEGERLGSTRLIRAAKNRFGSTDEVGVLEMRGDGLVEVADASRFFLESEQPPVAGSAVTIALEGTRPLAVEIQALVAPSGCRIAPPRHHGDRRQPRADADRGAGPPCRREPHRPRRLRQRGGRPAHRGAGGGPGGGRGTGLQPARAPGAERDGPGRRALPGGTAAPRRTRRAAPGRGAAAGVRSAHHRPVAEHGRRLGRAAWKRPLDVRSALLSALAEG